MKRCHHGRDPAASLRAVRAVVAENVMTRREGRSLYLPLGLWFTLGGEIQRVVTAIAKTHLS